MDRLEPQGTALVLIDLQKGIAPFAGGPHAAVDVFVRAGMLAARFRALGAPVVLVRVGWSADAGDVLRQPVDRPAPTSPQGLPHDWLEFPDELAVADSDIRIVKRQWGAFHGTELDLQLRRRGVSRIVLAASPPTSGWSRRRARRGSMAMH